ncbi:gliding motility-associated ABC transporter substrate-binding protein GldG [Ancylomarina sp. 16SWW S1-10-2]|uniref:gliding motility-associated ABC transporter substrate-binding protein GldG n=1 Tax=Ancylomarina sp. 16SWW S1-10-2 TaxID=2499681 RepID=UPI0012AD89C1|nr:gliding motility-associated ABC transporter substrate-binding protein GldG [Ancylomarina sp. 16SWW S1-10-2]MRT93740.1 gliding motility-associated ABC transporter substrate-binding protein GldG [Ancylomarina sp. 16SWW S1-10-2]
MQITNKKKNLIQLVLSILIVLTVYQFLQVFHFRIDLTSEKRFTLSDNTKKLLSKLEKPVYFEIYLTGDLPHGFNKLKNATVDLIDEFKSYSNVEIAYSFVDPSSVLNPKQKDKNLRELAARGLEPTSIQETGRDGSVKQKIIVPGLFVHDGKKETPVNLLKSVTGLSAEENLNYAIESVEYELSMAIRMLNQTKVKEIAFFTGQGELGEYEVADFTTSLLQRYEVNRVTAHELSKNYKRFDCVIVAQPRNEFTERAKYALDQYIMNGGRVMWLIDEVSASMDSISAKGMSMAFYKPLNLEDQLFRYGVRINPDLLMDVQSQLIPVQATTAGQDGKYIPAPWYYSPLLAPPNNHPITRKLNMVRVEFANSIDKVGKDPKLKHTVLLASSDNTRLEKVPTPIRLDIVGKKMNAEDFSDGSKVISVLIEGQFQSIFKDRIWKGIDKSTFKSESAAGKMIVISDGDIIKNRVRGVGSNIQIMPLGYDRYSRKTYGNSNFLLNCVDYLCDDEGWMNLRSREVKLRLLDKTKIREHRLFYQIVNLALPIALLILLALVWHFVRKRKYAN